MATTAALRSIDLILTSECNLRCGYCYQNDKKSGEMAWGTMRSALDRLLASESQSIRVGFWGGEPLLEFPLLQKAVAYVEDKLEPGRSAAYSVSTNGLLLTDEILAFLVHHRFEIQLSFDGVPAMQDLRRRNSFHALDGLLDRMSAHESGRGTHDLRIAITITPETIEFLPDSIAYFLEKGVPHIAVAPVNYAPQWQVDDIAKLDRMMKVVFDLCVKHFRRTGQMPLALFGGKGSKQKERSKESIPMCGAPFGRGVAVDVNGDTHGCITFAGSYQRFRSAWLKEQIDSMSIGPIDGGDFETGLAAYPDASRKTGMFHAKENKYSSYGKCGECEYVDRCGICPMSIGNIPGNRDPDRMPDFACAFMKTTHRYRDRFPVAPREGMMTSEMQKLLAMVGGGDDSAAGLAQPGLLDFLVKAGAASR